ncbi:hypothetical protein H8959_016773, partial [Pygathrix nigripes]
MFTRMQSWKLCLWAAEKQETSVLRPACCPQPFIWGTANTFDALQLGHGRTNQYGKVGYGESLAVGDTVAEDEVVCEIETDK